MYAYLRAFWAPPLSGDHGPCKHSTHSEQLPKMTAFARLFVSPRVEVEGFQLEYPG